jgi:membrane fusion protein, multidrug efflux system
MKYIIFAAVLLLMLVSCGKNAQTETPNDAAGVKTLLQGKKVDLQKLQAEIVDLEKLLNKLDTTTKIAKKVLVSTMAISKKTFEHFVEVQANVATSEDPAFASSETGGRIVEMLVKEGDMVKKGELVARVNLESIQKSIDQLSKSMELAQDIFERQEKLWKQNIGSEVQYLQSKNQVESLQKNKESLEFELKKASVYAPASGIVEMVMVKNGEMCGPASPIIQIVNSSALKIVANAPEIYLPSVKRGDGIKVTFPALGKEQTAKVSMIGRTINPSNRTFEIEALIGNEGGLVKPNLLATIFIKDYSKNDAISLPVELIMQDVSGNNFVMINEQNKAAKRIVTLGKTYMNEIEILSGLGGEEMVLTKGARLTVEGDLLEVIQEPLTQK